MRAGVLALLAALALSAHATAAAVDCARGTHVDPQHPSQCRPCSPGTFSDIQNASLPAQLTHFVDLRATGISRGSRVLTYSRKLYNAQPVYYMDYGYPVTDFSLFRMLDASWRYGLLDPSRGYWPVDVAAGEIQALLARATDVNYCFYCQRGFHQPEPGQASCLPCPFNTYTDGLAPSPVCRPCPDASRCCRPGTYLRAPSDAECTPCWRGSYNFETGRSTCQLCPAGYASPEGSLLISACTKCGTGKFSTQGGACTPCQPGTYADITGLGACKPCPPGLHAPAPGSARCSPCPPGTASNATQCLPCAPGTFQDAPGQPACDPCPPGFFTPEPGSLACWPCGAGNYSTGAECLPCAPGTFNDKYQQTACEACSPGHYQDAEGATECGACYDGTFSALRGGQTCTLCNPGTFSAGMAQTACSTCPANTFADQLAVNECFPCTTWNIVSPAGSSEAPFPTTVIAEGISPVDCHVDFRTNEFILFFFFLVESSMITLDNTRKYRAATAHAMGIQVEDAYLFATPITPEAVADAMQLRAIILGAVGVDVFEPLGQFLGDGVYGINRRRRRLLQAPDAPGLLYFLIHVNTANLALATSLAAQVPTDTFKARLDLACADAELAQVTVVPDSVQYYSPLTEKIVIVPRVLQQLREDEAQPSPPPMPPPAQQPSAAPRRQGAKVAWAILALACATAWWCWVLSR